MISRACILYVLLVLAAFTQLCLSADTTFQWGWSSRWPQHATGVLTECEVMHIELINHPTFGSAPYYFMAYEPGGFSTATFAGTDPSDLIWQVKYAAGTKLMLGMVDADGNSGGIADLYTVDSGKDVSCLPPMPSSSLVIKTNVTQLSRCEPCGLRISGGTPPYNITLAMLDIPSTNVTLPLGLDVLTYVNTANFSGQMLAAVSDLTGQFGRTTPLIDTIGSVLGCNGLETRPGNSNDIPFYSSSSSSKRTTIIIAVSVVGGLLVIAGAILFTLRKILVRRMREDQDTVPRAFEIQNTTEEHKQMAQVASSSASPPDPSQSASDSWGVGRPPLSSNDLWQQHNAQSPRSFDPNLDLGGSAVASHDRSLSADSSLTPTTFNVTQPHRARTHSHTTRSADDEEARNATASNHPTRVSPLAVRVQDLDPDTEPDIIIQHRDGGDLPPPYLNQL